MFTSEIPTWVLEAARANVAEAANLTADKDFKISGRTRIPTYPEPIELLTDAVGSARLTLYIFAENTQRVVPVPANFTQEILERGGFFRSTSETISFRLTHFFPRRILAGLDFPEISMAEFDKFGMCLRESAFDAWLASTAHQQCWPVDAIPRSGRGRPPPCPPPKIIL